MFGNITLCERTENFWIIIIIEINGELTLKTSLIESRIVIVWIGLTIFM